jgi:hypothetical protein
MVAQRQAGARREPRLSRRKGDRRGQPGRGLLQVPLGAALRELEGLIQGRELLLTVRTVEVGPGQGDLADHGVHRARRSRARRQEPVTVGATHGALLHYGYMQWFDQGFSHLTRQLLPPREHGLRQLLQAGGVVWPVGLQSIQPTIQLCMQRLAGSRLGKGLSGFCQGDYGCRGHRGFLHRWDERVSSLTTLPHGSPSEAGPLRIT